VLIVIALLVSAAFMILIVLADLARDLSRHSFQVPPDLHSSDDWDLEVDEFADAPPPMVSQTDQSAVNRYRIPAPSVRWRKHRAESNSRRHTLSCGR
jgi:hypothetical protein